jgi:retron-type reverse transcriptase
MQMIPSAYAIGQTECDASRAMGARTFVTRLAFTEWSDGLAKLALELRQDTYRPDPIRRVLTPEASGKLRPLGVSTWRDRVCMTAARLVLAPYGGSARSKRWTVDGPRAANLDQEGPLTRST